ncbi:MAG: GTP-binding protein [Deltaproteobacteria bacterium]|nr:GTP-binding protein [Deltaproteobacteria bacterium]
MKILIVSGFLGAGKTTFIKELIRRSNARPVILENEYGENNLDARALQQSLSEPEDMKILEFMEGCVCCTMKGSFVNSVLTIFSGLDPKHLVIEPTGVGRLSSILENLRPILHDRIRLLKPVVVLPPQSYHDHMAEWPRLYGDQIAHAGVVVFSKAEHADPDVLEEIAAQICLINPRAEIITEHYSLQPDAWWKRLMDLPAEAPAVSPDTPAGERLSQLSFQTSHLHHPAELVLLLEDCLRGEFGRVVRAKGVLPAGGELLRFDLADRQYAITGTPQAATQSVFIGTGLRKDALCRRLGISPEEEALRPSSSFSQRRQAVKDGVFPRISRNKAKQ